MQLLRIATSKRRRKTFRNHLCALLFLQLRTKLVLQPNRLTRVWDGRIIGVACTIGANLVETEVGMVFGLFSQN